ncbi:MAG TPA: chemotaxis protein CheW [Acidimicrobiales bacterium]|nr:chemotaxis protein CheW [Acidimicrobiales bacterium]
MTGDAEHAGQYCTFTIDDDLYGIAVEEIQEVIVHQDMTPAPLAPPAVRGLINLRGQVVIAIDMRTRLGLPPLAEGRLPTNIVVSAAGGTVSLLVDEIGEVLDLDTGFEDPPATLRGVARQLIRAVCRLDDRLLQILDVTAAIAVRAG